MGARERGLTRWPNIMVKSNYGDRALNPAWIALWPLARHLTPLTLTGLFVNWG